MPGFYCGPGSANCIKHTLPGGEMGLKDRRAESKALGADVVCDYLGARMCPEMSSSLTTGGLLAVR